MSEEAVIVDHEATCPEHGDFMVAVEWHPGESNPRLVHCPECGEPLRPMAHYVRGG